MDTDPEAGCVQGELPMLVSIHERVWAKLCKHAFRSCCGADLHSAKFAGSSGLPPLSQQKDLLSVSSKLIEKVAYLIRVVML